jgi:hypothetical protein
LAITKLRMLADAGVDTIIDLTEDVNGLEPYSHLLNEIADDTGHSIRRYRHPIPNNHVTDDAGYDDILFARVPMPLAVTGRVLSRARLLSPLCLSVVST